MKRSLLFLCLTFIAAALSAQVNTTYRSEVMGTIASDTHTPFWLTNQSWGVVPLDANSALVRGAVFHDHRLHRDWHVKVGADIVVASDSPYGNAWIQQLFVRLDWKALRLDLGAQEDYTSLLNPSLSSGDFVNSNNARPIPEIKGSIPEFIPVPYTKGNFYLKGDISIGKYLDGDWMADRARPHNESYARDILSHRKSISFRFGDIEKQPQQFTVSLFHLAQWGGQINRYSLFDGELKYKVTDQPTGLGDLFRVMIAKEGSALASGADQAYVSGSQMGAYTFRYDRKLPNNDRVGAYIHHFFEDGSGMAFENYLDNVYGLEYRSDRKGLVSGLVLEYIYTKQQTGPIHFNIIMDDEHQHLASKGNANDNYYNNIDYTQGPSHFGKSMGSPLLLAPQYNDDGAMNFKGNRIAAFHAGVEGYLLPELRYRVLLSTGQSWGRFYAPFTAIHNGFASMIEFVYANERMNGMEVKLSGGYNQGSFFGPEALGVGVSLTKRGSIFSK